MYIASFVVLTIDLIQKLPSKTKKIKVFDQMVQYKYNDRSVIYINNGTGLYQIKLTSPIPNNSEFYDDVELALYLFNINQESEMAINWIQSEQHKHEFYGDYVIANRKNRKNNHNQLLKQLLCQSIGSEFVELSVITILTDILNRLETNTQSPLTLKDRLTIIEEVIKPLGYNSEFINKYVFLYAMEQFLKLRKI